MGYIIVLCICIALGVFFANSYLLKNIEGVYEYTDGIDSWEITVLIDTDKQAKRFKVVGKFPEDNKPFLSYGTYPFLYMVSLYPINNPTANLKLTFIPFPMVKPGEFKKVYYLTLKRPMSTQTFEFKKIDNITKEASDD